VCEVFTDKLIAKIPATADGIVKRIHFEEDDIALVRKTNQVGAILMEIDSESAEAEAKAESESD
jgi:pyruvate/2-oxoglutarate dehydrogenase complex dihydrolipoamide acyltransferase (E2) component